MSISMVGQQSLMLSRLSGEEREHHCPQKAHKRRKQKSKERHRLFKNLVSHIEPTQQACLLQVYRSLPYGDLRMVNYLLLPARLQSQNPRCLHDYHQDKTRTLRQTHLHLPQTTAPLRNNSLPKPNISIKGLWDGSGKLVSLSLALA